MRLLTLIDSELFRNGQPTWEGGAEELQRELTKDGAHARGKPASFSIGMERARAFLALFTAPIPKG